MTKKKIERVTVVRAGVFHRPSKLIGVVDYVLSCGDTFFWLDAYPPTYCPFCGRMIDYAGPEEEGEQ